MPEEFMNWLEEHPLMTALLVFLVFFIGYQWYKGRQSSGAVSSVPTSTPTYYDYSQATYNTQAPGKTGPAGPAGPTGPAGPAGPAPKPIHKPPTHGRHDDDRPRHPGGSLGTSSQYVVVQPYPSQLSTLWGIADYVNKPRSHIEALNPEYDGNWHLVYAGQKVRIS